LIVAHPARGPALWRQSVDISTFFGLITAFAPVGARLAAAFASACRKADHLLDCDSDFVTGGCSLQDVSLALAARDSRGSMNQNYGEIVRTISEILAAATKGRFAVNEGTLLKRDLNLDSLAEMDLLMTLEDRFDVSISLNHLPEMETVRDLAQAIAKIKKGAA
jgi:acyl carrier protein